jgi:hypothetical protein
LDIPSPLQYSSTNNVVAQDKSNEIIIWPITRSHAKLLELFIEYDISIDENFILCKSLQVQR